MKRWKRRPEGANWGDFGEDDQLGRLNLITPARVRAAAQEIQSGRTFCLSLPLDLPGGNVLNPRRHPPVLRPTFRDDVAYVNFPLAKVDPRALDVLSDDQVLLSMQYSTQWDSLAHVGALFDADGDGVAERVYYNGFRPNADIVGPVDYAEADHFAAHACGHDHSHADALGIETFAAHGIQARGVLVDLAEHYGRECRTVGYEDLMRVIDADGIEVGSGDILVLRTGFAEMLVEMAGEPDAERLHQSCCALDGRDDRLLQWITDSGIAAIAADNYAVERYPARPVPAEQGPVPMLPLHHHCLFKLGLPLGELWYLRDLAHWLRAEGRHRFFLSAPPLRLPGAMGSPVTPVATT